MQTRTLTTIGVWTVGLGWLLGCVPPAAAQSGDILATEVRTCAAKGEVTITVLGQSKTVPIGCVNSTEQTEPGMNEAAVADVNLEVGGMVEVASVQAPYGLAEIEEIPQTTRVAGTTEVGGLRLVQGMVDAQNLAGVLDCAHTEGSDVIECRAGTVVGQFLVNGEPVAVPAPIPFNWTVGLSSTVQLHLWGLPLLHVPVTGAVVLNEVRVEGEGTPEPTIAFNTLALRVEGHVFVLGVGLVGVRIEIVDSVDAEIGVTEDVRKATIDCLAAADIVQCIGGIAVD